MSPQGDLEERVEKIEQKIEQVLSYARSHPLGRKILLMLGLE